MRDIDALIYKATGVYFNKSTQCYEAWIVDPTTRDAKRIGWISAGIVREYPEAWQMWEQEIWREWLKKIFVLKEE
jgi:hypothetical protein